MNMFFVQNPTAKRRLLLTVLLIIVAAIFQNLAQAQEVNLNGVTLTGPATLTAQAPNVASSATYTTTVPMPPGLGNPFTGAGFFVKWPDPLTIVKEKFVPATNSWVTAPAGSDVSLKVGTNPVGINWSNVIPPNMDSKGVMSVTLSA